MIAMAGLGARVKALIDVINASVIPAVREVPWKVTSLPTAYQVADNTYAGATGLGILTAARCSDSTLAADTTLQTIVDVSGSGFLEFAAVYGSSAAGTLRIVITVDGVDLVDTTGASASLNRLLYGCGALIYTGAIAQFDPWRVPYRSSLVIKAQQSTTTLAAKLYYRYRRAAPYTG